MYARENFRKAKDIIEERRLRAAAEAEARNLEVASRSEDIRLIDAELRNTGMLIFKTACAGGDISPIRERNLFLSEERRRALKKLGLPEDYTEVRYTCPECSDTGYSGGKICKCLKELFILENIKSSGIGKLIEKQSFENFDLNRYSDDSETYERMKHNLEAAKRFVDNFGSGSSTLLFTGDTGTGKTHLTTAIAKALIEKGVEVLYDSAQNIVSAFEYDRFKNAYGQEEPKGEKYLSAEMLIVDDLGTEFVNQFTVSAIYNLINTRQNKGLFTIFSTNLKPAEVVRKYDDRIYSRLFGAETEILVFLGDDNRLK